MKRILLILSVALVTACSQPEIRNEVFEPTLDSLYVQCKDLKGLGSLHIGKTTLRQVQKDKGITLHEYFRKPSFVGGYWGESAYDRGWGTYLDKKTTKIKQFKITDINSKYKIGELEIEDVCLAFYNDTLVAISFDCTGEMLKHYISKYGAGKGSNYEYTYRKGEYGNSNFVFEYKHIENRLWANEYVSMEYKTHWEQRTAPKEKHKSYSTKSCVISSNSRYADFLRVLEDYKTQYKNEQDAKKKTSYDSL